MFHLEKLWYYKVNPGLRAGGLGSHFHSVLSHRTFPCLGFFLCKMGEIKLKDLKDPSSYVMLWFSKWSTCLTTHSVIQQPICSTPVIDGTYAGMPREGNGNPLQYSCLENPQMEEPGSLHAVHGVAKSRCDWATSVSLFTFMHWRRKWQPSPVFLPGESRGQGNLVGCRLWGRTESDTTEVT